MSTSFGDKLFYLINYLVLSLIAISCLLPLLYIVSVSLSDNHAILSGNVSLWPKGWTLGSYRVLFEGTRILQSFINSVIITVIGTVLCLVFTVLAAYPLSRKAMFARKAFTLGIVFTMIFSGGLIPSFLIVRSLGLLDTYGSLWVPALVSTFNMLVIKNYFENLPEEMEEAARIDGCGEWRFLTQIVLRLSLPVVATIGLFYAIGFWNMFFSVLIYISDSEKYNLAVLVQRMLQNQTILQELNNRNPREQVALTPEGIRAAGIMIMVIPMLIVYPFMQRYFIKGVLIGAIKG